jgi:subtilisin family serine protease
VAALQAGEPVEVIVDVDTLALDAEVFAMAHAAGRTSFGPSELTYRRSGLASIKQEALASLEGITVLETLAHLSTGLVRVDTEAALSALLARPQVIGVHADEAELAPLVDESFPLVGLAVVAAGIDSAPALGGEGTVIAIFDTGVDYLDPFFGCTAPGVPSTCPVMDYRKFGPQNEPPDPDGHGTAVTAIAHLVAPKAKLVVADVLGGDRIFDTMQAFDWLMDLKEAEVNVVAVNMSYVINPTPGMASFWYESQQECEADSPLMTTVSQAIAAGIQPIAASGNRATVGGTFIDGIVHPSCIPGVVSVGAVYDENLGTNYDASGFCTDPTANEDQVTCFSQTATFLSLLAPGAVIQVPPALAASHTIGTSFAAPHVAGAWAILRSVFPNDMLHQTLERLTRTGRDVDDHRVPGGRIKPRLDLLAALDEPDGDEVPLLVDNCNEDSNPGALGCDEDEDGFGNACDCDLNNDWVCDTDDIPIFKAALVANDPIGDINCNGLTDTGDINPFKTLVGDPRRPGPSGLSCQRTIPCTP